MGICVSMFDEQEDHIHLSYYQGSDPTTPNNHSDQKVDIPYFALERKTVLLTEQKSRVDIHQISIPMSEIPVITIYGPQNNQVQVFESQSMTSLVDYTENQNTS